MSPDPAPQEAEPQGARPTVVLVEPQVPANLGFVARALDNFGLGEARLLGGCGWRGTEAERTGAPARARLEALRQVETWDEACAGCTHLIGFTARQGRHRVPVPLDGLATHLDDWGPAARPGFVFGREDRGLETDEVDACHLLIRIPTAGLASLNLSHAVAVAGYAWRVWADGAGTQPSDLEARVASQPDRQRLAQRVAEELQAAGFRDDADDVTAALRRLGALPVQTRDLRLLERIVRHARWLRESREDGTPHR